MAHHKHTRNVFPTNRTSKIDASTCNQSCRSSVCLFCLTKEADKYTRRKNISEFFKKLPERDDDEEVVMLVSWLRNIAIGQPDDPYHFTSLGIFECMAKLIHTGVHDKEWLSRGQNICIPYYAADVIGYYTMNKSKFAEKAVKAGVVLPLIELMRGKMSWVEQRVSVRVLGHLASYETTFSCVVEYEEEMVDLAVEIASTCLEKVYKMNIASKESVKRMEYHRDLLTGGVGGMETAKRKAEEWASQLQCWSLHLLSCFAYKERSLDLICTNLEFLESLCDMWGGLVNDSSSAGYGLIRTLCYSKYGRKKIASLNKVVECLGHLARSSDDWQIIGVESLLLLLTDPDSRCKVIDVATYFLVDLVELRSLNGKLNVGVQITNILFSHSREVRSMIEQRKRGKFMSDQKMEEMKVLVGLSKHQGNAKFRSGDIEEALRMYSEGLEFCPLKLRSERIVLFSNRAQCHLFLRDPDAAISDTTKALCLVTPHNSHSKSLWRRSQAYDMKGFAKESLMDCLMFVNCCTQGDSINYVKIPSYAARMIHKQMSASWLFKDVFCRSSLSEIACDEVKRKRNQSQPVGSSSLNLAVG